MKQAHFFFLLLTLSFSVQAGDTPFPRTAVLPSTIDVTTAVNIGVAANLGPCIGSSIADPTFFHLSEDGHITFVFLAYYYSPCPIFNDYGLQFNVGTFPAGQYTVQVYAVGNASDVPTSIDEVDLDTWLGPLLNFEVRGPVTPAMVPINNGVGLFVMAGLFVLLLFIKLRRKKRALS